GCWGALTSAVTSGDAILGPLLCSATQPAGASSFGILDLFVAGAGFDIAGAWLLARGLTISPGRAAQRIVQGRNTFARFSVRSAEDYADGQMGRASLALGFL